MVQHFEAFRFELIPNGEQASNMRSFAGMRRYVYNEALKLQQERYSRGERNLSYAALCQELTHWRNDPKTAWLADGPVHIQQQALIDLNAAYKNFFEKRADAPVRKKKGRCLDSFRYPDPKQITVDSTNGRIKLPKLGWMRYWKSQDVLGEVRNVTVSYHGGKWYVSILTLRVVEAPIHKGGVIGIDLGVKRFATFSDGKYIEPLNSFKRLEKKLAKEQRKMDRKIPFSKNWIKSKKKVQKIHAEIANARKDFLHKATTAISKNHAEVFVEDLQVGNMTKSAAGTIDAPGRNVRAKSGLNKSILDQGWGEFQRQLEYKLSWNGGRLIKVPPQNTSRTCPICGHVSADNRKTQADFECVNCGYKGNADHVGAINVLTRGMEKQRDEGQDTADASAGCSSTGVQGTVRGHSPDRL